MRHGAAAVTGGHHLTFTALRVSLVFCDLVSIHAKHQQRRMKEKAHNIRKKVGHSAERIADAQSHNTLDTSLSTQTSSLLMCHNPACCLRVVLMWSLIAGPWRCP
jgi:hypothetical protein